jgi:hypothetical protein
MNSTTYYVAIMPASKIAPASFQVHHEHKPHLIGSIQIEDPDRGGAPSATKYGATLDCHHTSGVRIESSFDLMERW